MIPRYSRPEMTAVWSPETRFRIWFEIEAHAADAMAELGIIPKEAARKVWEKGKDAKFDVEIVPQGGKLKIVGYAGVKLFSQTFTWTKAPGDLQRCQS